MKISKKVLAILIVAILAIVGIVALVISSGNDENHKEEKGNPTFMYFVTNKDIENKDTTEVIEKLKEKYGKSVDFEIKNVDEDESVLKNFSIVTDKTPALIMLDGAGDIADILFETTDYDELNSVIRDTLKK